MCNSMQRILCILALALCLSTDLLAVNCIPDQITLSTQTEFDSFQMDHGPGCGYIVKSLIINGASIIDLSPLPGLETAGWGSIIEIREIALIAHGEEGIYGENSISVIVAKNHPPHQPILPVLANGATSVLKEITLSWTGGDIDADRVMYDVYLSAGKPLPDDLICAGVTITQ